MRYVIDASMGCRDGMFTFCPIEGDIEGDFTILTGLNYISAVLPDGMEMVGIIHPDGQAAVEQFCNDFKAELDGLKNNEQRN